MKSISFLLTIVLLISKSTVGQTTITIQPWWDAYIVAYGGGEGKNTFMKFDLSAIPPNAVAINTELRVHVKGIGTNWDRDVMFIHYLNQAWSETDSTQEMWDNMYWGDTLVQTLPLFGDSIGYAYSMDLSALLNQDIFAGNSYFTFRMKDPDDPTMFPMLNIPITNNFDTLIIGNIFDDYIIIQPKDIGLAQYRPIMDVTYIIMPSVDSISGYGVFCENENISLSPEISGDGPFTFQWQKDNIDISGETDSILIINSIQLSDSGWYRLIVNNPWAADTSVAVQCIVNSCVGINSSQVSDPIIIYPNPANNRITIHSTEEHYQVELTNICGDVLFNGQNSKEINVIEFNPGTYILTVYGNNFTKREKIIIY